MRIFVAQLNPTIGDIAGNTRKAIQTIQTARKMSADLVVFPELFLSGYPPEDLLYQPNFMTTCRQALDQVIQASSHIAVVIGTPRINPDTQDKPFYNSAAVIQDGRLLGFQDKTLLPTYDVFDERRFFAPAGKHQVWTISGKKIAITICEDIWPFAETSLEDCTFQSRYPIDPLTYYEATPIDLLLNISASPYSAEKIAARKQIAQACSRRLSCPLILCNQVGAQDGLLFDGTSVAYTSEGESFLQMESFLEECVCVDLSRQTTVIPLSSEAGEELFSALVMGVRDYFHKQGFTKACVGLSGGVDSSVVACIAVHALGKKNVVGYLLPSRFTSQASLEDALYVAEKLSISTKIASIEKSYEAILQTISPLLQKEPNDLLEQNVQARIRGMLLMAFSNQEGSLVLNTSNKSELAVGYSTLYGDSIGSIAVIGDLLKKDVYAVALYLQKQWGYISDRIIEKEPTAELKIDQKDSDTLPEYEILDPIVEAYVVHGASEDEIADCFELSIALVQDVIKKIHASEYKRRQVPFALRVSEKAFSCGRKIPIVHQ